MVKGGISRLFQENPNFILDIINTYKGPLLALVIILIVVIILKWYQMISQKLEN